VSFAKCFPLTIDAMARFLQKLQDVRIVVSSQDLPTFLYEDSKYDPMEWTVDCVVAEYWFGCVYHHTTFILLS
jgi:hypothetical protein